MKKVFLHSRLIIIELALIIFGSITIAFTFFLLMSPNEIMPPGLGGIAALLSYVLPLSFGSINFILNIPLFILSYRYAGTRFIIYSLVGTSSLSLALHVLAELPGITQAWLGAIGGGILSGAALAIVLLAGGSTGGLDMACVVINRLWPRWTIGRVMFLINSAIVITSGFVFGFKQSLLTILSFYLSGKTLDICYAYGLRVKEQALELSKQEKAEG